MRRLLLGALFGVAACTQQGWNDRLASPQEQARTLRDADLLRAGKIDRLLNEATPELRQQIAGYSRQVSPILTPVHGTFQLQAVSSFVASGAPAMKTFVMQGGSDNHWAVVQMVYQGSGTATQLAGLDVKPFTVDPSSLDSFKIARQGALGYFWLTMMMASAATCIWANVLIWRRPWLKRRWLWSLGSLFGFAGFGLNWSTGAWAILFVNVSLLGVQAVKVGPYAPWLLSFGVPVVAIIVILRWYRGERGII